MCRCLDWLNTFPATMNEHDGTIITTILILWSEWIWCAQCRQLHSKSACNSTQQLKSTQFITEMHSIPFADGGEINFNFIFHQRLVRNRFDAWRAQPAPLIRLEISRSNDRRLIEVRFELISNWDRSEISIFFNFCCSPTVAQLRLISRNSDSTVVGAAQLDAVVLLV